MNYEQLFDQKRIELENYISDRLVSLTIYSMSNSTVDSLDRIIEERKRIMVEVDRAFGFKKETPS